MVILENEIDYSAFEKVSSGPAVTRISQQAEADIKFGYCTEFIILLNKPLPGRGASQLQGVPYINW